MISDDGSSDSTLDIISAFNDCRIKVYHNPAKSGGLMFYTASTLISAKSKFPKLLYNKKKSTI